MNWKVTSILVASCLIFIAGYAMALQGGADGRPNSGSYPIYVESQGLYYDTFVTADPLPYNGHNGNSFQELYMTEMGATTMYGPGNPGYRGGRWWQDLNGNDIMDSEGIDHYFLCPLLPPGYI